MSHTDEPKPSEIRAARHLAAVNASAAPRRFLRIADVVAAVGLTKGCIYKMIRRGEFPAPVKLTSRSSAWVASEVDAFAERRIAARFGQAA